MPCWKEYLEAVLDLLLPRTCLVCGKTLARRERHLCLSCASDLPCTYFWLERHNPMADRLNAVLERQRGTEPMDYAFAAALLYYKGDYRNLPRALKYRGDLDAGRHFGRQLGRRLAATPHFADVDLVIPVPLHWTRRWSRGYNQAEVLSRAIAAVLQGSGPSSVPCRTDLLVRARRTRSQTRMRVGEKERNVASAFRVPERESAAEALSRARHILLVDDTFTTGATLAACYRALRPCTAARISVATLAAVEGATPAL